MQRQSKLKTPSSFSGVKSFGMLMIKFEEGTSMSLSKK